jgi:hypothetical protein
MVKLSSVATGGTSHLMYPCLPLWSFDFFNLSTII